MLMDELVRRRSAWARIAGSLTASTRKMMSEGKRPLSVGLVRHVHLGHGPGLYELAGRPPREYLYCERCGTLTEIAGGELNPIREQITERFGFQARFTHFPIVGLCQTCSILPATADAPRTGSSHPDPG